MKKFLIVLLFVNSAYALNNQNYGENKGPNCDAHLGCGPCMQMCLSNNFSEGVKSPKPGSEKGKKAKKSNTGKQ